MIVFLCLLLVVCAMTVAFVDSHLMAVMAASLISLLLSLIFALLQAPDVALTEAAVGAGLGSIIYIVALFYTKSLK
jgi:energy-converting hydrogenase B subunit D